MVKGVPFMAIPKAAYQQLRKTDTVVVVQVLFLLREKQGLTVLFIARIMDSQSCQCSIRNDHNKIPKDGKDRGVDGIIIFVYEVH